MRDYRLYCMDAGGHIDLADWFAAETDDEAVTKALQLRPDASKREIWHKSRLIARIDAEGRVERFDG
jgi:hypothetical protein